MRFTLDSFYLSLPYPFSAGKLVGLKISVMRMFLGAEEFLKEPLTPSELRRTKKRELLSGLSLVCCGPETQTQTAHGTVPGTTFSLSVGQCGGHIKHKSISHEWVVKMTSLATPKQHWVKPPFASISASLFFGHRLHAMLETLLWNSASCWHDNVTTFLQIHTASHC